MSTVIIGAGIIGTSTAYYLSQSSKNPIHLVEASPQLFESASGYAAGFLARDWFVPSLSALGELSFDLHKQLAEENDGHARWGYSRSTGTSLAETVGKNGADWLMEGVSRATAAASHSNVSGNRPAWLSPGEDLDVMSDGSTTAQWYILSMCLPVQPVCSVISLLSISIRYDLLHSVLMLKSPTVTHCSSAASSCKAANLATSTSINPPKPYPSPAPHHPVPSLP